MGTTDACRSHGRSDCHRDRAGPVATMDDQERAGAGPSSSSRGRVMAKRKE